MLQKVKNYFHFFEALIASLTYGFPSKKLYLIGVTGTDGKTTTTSLIHHILRTAKINSGMISTVGAKVIDKEITVGLHTTTPSAFLIQKLLRKMVDNGCTHAVLEVTSHSVDQNRIVGCTFQIGILTNITHEHLDYHRTLKAYIKTKAQFLKKCNKVILNNDCSSFEKVKSQLSNKKIISYGLTDSPDLKATPPVSEENGQNFSVDGKVAEKSIHAKVSTSLLGVHNISNILAGIAAAVLLKIPEDIIIAGIKTFTPVKGRLEMVIKDPFKVIVDFAHTPNAFQNVLPTTRQITKGKIIHVFGATGKRDREKRPMMGEISGKLADVSILTSEDTYGEDPAIIMTEVEEGIKKTPKQIEETYWKIADRKKAIKKALDLAREGDTILLTGVGHQTSLNLGSKELPWNDPNVVRELMKDKDAKSYQR